MITKKDLLNWLKEIDSKLKNQIVLTAVGGTAMTLLNLKESTIDIDFDIDKSNYNEFNKLVLQSKKFRVDLFQNGYIFSEQLPEDYVNIAIEYNEVKFRNLILKILNPIDIILTKAARYSTRDEEDISILVKKTKIDIMKLKERFIDILESYAGLEANFKYNFDFILKKHFNEQLHNNKFNKTSKL